MSRPFYVLAVASLLLAGNVAASDFDDWFEDKTLRIDFVFSGNSDDNYISVDGLTSFDNWYGRRDNMLDCGPSGNAYVLVKDRETNRCLYKFPFSSLMQEWVLTDEAKSVTKSFDNPVLVPFPKKDIVVDVYFRDNYGDYNKLYSQVINPDDILIKDVTGKKATPHDYVLHSGDSRKCIDIVLVPEGYSYADREKWEDDARKVKEILFSHNPFDRLQDKFNVIRVDTFSHDSGVSVPRDKVWRETVLGSHFDTFYADRYLTTSNMKDLHIILEDIPYEEIIIVANSKVYGGGGIYNYYMLTSDLDGYPEVLVHEFGHSYAGLGDEYYYDNDISLAFYQKGVEPWEPNLTTLSDFGTKWADLVEDGVEIPTNGDRDGKVGAYEGGGYAKYGVYRPVYDECRMKKNSAPDFCPVCERAIITMTKLLYNE